MKRKEAIQKVKEHENAVEVERIKKLRELEAKLDLENRESNYNRARSITVGTSFGGTTEIMMRGDGGRHLWCVMQPVEVIELIYQLSANVGCNAQLTPRKDFASWRDWRVSEAEKKHLNGHAPFVNDMALVQNLGRSGYDDNHVQKILDDLAKMKDFANDTDDAKIVGQESKGDGAPSLMIGEEDGLLHNKLAIKNGELLQMSGGTGGDPTIQLRDLEEQNETVATKKSANR
jgi:hypothetical protein